MTTNETAVHSALQGLTRQPSAHSFRRGTIADTAFGNLQNLLLYGAIRDYGYEPKDGKVGQVVIVLADGSARRFGLRDASFFSRGMIVMLRTVREGRIDVASL